jgi:hypothetical protein
MTLYQLQGYLASSDKIMHDEHIIMWKAAAVAYFNVLSQHSIGLICVLFNNAVSSKEVVRYGMVKVKSCSCA